MTGERKEDDMELKPCPFCGGKAKMEKIIHDDLPTNEFDTFWISCEECESESTACTNEEDAIEAWNRRVTE